MRWKSKVILESGGNTRIRRKFLLLPLTVNGEVRWLEWVTVKEIWRRGYIDTQEISHLSWKIDKIIDSPKDKEQVDAPKV